MHDNTYEVFPIQEAHVSLGVQRLSWGVNLTDMLTPYVAEVSVQPLQR